VNHSLVANNLSLCRQQPLFSDDCLWNRQGEQAVARVVVVLNDLFGLPVTSGAVGVLEGRLFSPGFPPVMRCADRATFWRALWLWAVQLQYQAAIQPDTMLSNVHL
jgi:hypothetical protein